MHVLQHGIELLHIQGIITTHELKVPEYITLSSAQKHSRRAEQLHSWSSPTCFCSQTECHKMVLCSYLYNHGF